jgi:hypothetical protein
MQNLTLIWKIQGLLLLPTLLKYEKQQHHFDVNKFFGRKYFGNFSTGFEIIVKFCVF